MPPSTDLKNITRYPEFAVFKQELLKFCDTMDNISDIKLDEVSRISVVEEIVGRRWASDKVRDFLMKLGILDVGDSKRDKTYE